MLCRFHKAVLLLNPGNENKLRHNSYKLPVGTQPPPPPTIGDTKSLLLELCAAQQAAAQPPSTPHPAWYTGGPGLKP